MLRSTKHPYWIHIYAKDLAIWVLSHRRIIGRCSIEISGTEWVCLVENHDAAKALLHEYQENPILENQMQNICDAAILVDRCIRETEDRKNRERRKQLSDIRPQVERFDPNQMEDEEMNDVDLSKWLEVYDRSFAVWAIMQGVQGRWHVRIDGDDFVCFFENTERVDELFDRYYYSKIPKTVDKLL